jgi:hypothetical protein
MPPINLPLAVLVAYITLMSGYLAIQNPSRAAPICRAIQH